MSGLIGTIGSNGSPANAATHRASRGVAAHSRNCVKKPLPLLAPFSMPRTIVNYKLPSADQPFSASCGRARLLSATIVGPCANIMGWV